MTQAITSKIDIAVAARPRMVSSDLIKIARYERSVHTQALFRDLFRRVKRALSSSQPRITQARVSRA